MGGNINYQRLDFRQREGRKFTAYNTSAVDRFLERERIRERKASLHKNCTRGERPGKGACGRENGGGGRGERNEGKRKATS